MWAASRATIRNTTFERNTAQTSHPDFISAGPVMGLFENFKTGGFQPAAALFQDCQFLELVSEVPGAVAIESNRTHVFSDQELPTIWNLELSRMVKPRMLNATADPLSSDAFAAVETSGSPFPRPSDPVFQRFVREQAKLSGLEPGTPTSTVPELGSSGIAPEPDTGVTSYPESKPAQNQISATQLTAPGLGDTESDRGQAPMTEPAPAAVQGDAESMPQDLSTSSSNGTVPNAAEEAGGGSGDDRFWTKKIIIMTAGIVIGGLLLLLAACTAYIFFVKRPNRESERVCVLPTPAKQNMCVK